MANKREDSKLKIAKDAITQDWKRRQGKIGSLIGNQWLLTPISITDGILIAFLTPKRLNFSDSSTESLSIWKAKRPFDNSTRRRTWNILSRKENFGECLSAIHFFFELMNWTFTAKKNGTYQSDIDDRLKNWYISIQPLLKENSL